ncbi:MAG TPA: TolC family protein [Acidobacteriota bacterium]|nr:TolC family protein [Acidobacteriota bacterium]HRR27474.1 TolC family protein [Acidobacteriota bacterium]HRV08041.1 TolC family protein [Acidobacteriota bacterium]
MRRRLIVAFWALTGLVVSSDRVWGRQTPGESADRLSLAQAVELALERNPLIRSVQAGVSQAEAGLAEAEAGRLPNLSFEQGFTNSNNPVYVFGTLLEQERFGAEHFDPAFLNSPGSLSNFRSTVNLQMPLFNRFQVSSAIRQARLQQETAQAEEEWIRQQLRHRVVQAYFGVAVADFRRQVAEEAVKSAEADLERIRNKVDSGVAVVSDLLAMQVQLAEFGQRLVETEGDLRTAYAALNTLLDWPLERSVQLDTALIERDFPVADVQALVAEAVKNRPDYRNAERQVAVARELVRSARGEYWPDLNLFASVGRSSGNLKDGSGDFAVGARLSWNLVDFGREPRIRGRLAAVKAAEAERDALEQEIRLEIVRAVEQCRSAAERVRLARAAVDQADETLRIVRDRFEVGLTTITEVLRAQTASLQARLNVLGALYQHYVSFSQVQLAAAKLRDLSWFLD